jgi:hypothetical protein
VPAAPAELFFPHFADGRGCTTQFILFNATMDQRHSGGLRLFDQSKGRSAFLCKIAGMGEMGEIPECGFTIASTQASTTPAGWSLPSGLWHLKQLRSIHHLTEGSNDVAKPAIPSMIRKRAELREETDTILEQVAHLIGD